MPKLRKIHFYSIFINQLFPKFSENGSITETYFKTGSWLHLFWGPPSSIEPSDLLLFLKKTNRF